MKENTVISLADQIGLPHKKTWRMPRIEEASLELTAAKDNCFDEEASFCKTGS